MSTSKPTSEASEGNAEEKELSNEVVQAVPEAEVVKTEAPKAPEPKDDEKPKEPEVKQLNPANAAREAVFSIVKDREMSVDEQVSAIAPLLKTINEHRLKKGEEEKSLDEQEAEQALSPRAETRWNMLEASDSPPPQGEQVVQEIKRVPRA